MKGFFDESRKGDVDHLRGVGLSWGAVAQRDQGTVQYRAARMVEWGSVYICSFIEVGKCWQNFLRTLKINQIPTTIWETIYSRKMAEPWSEEQGLWLGVPRDSSLRCEATACSLGGGPAQSLEKPHWHQHRHTETRPELPGKRPRTGIAAVWPWGGGNNISRVATSYHWKCSVFNKNYEA